MTNLKEDEIFAIADHFGLDPQLKQLIEEMAELTQAICKYFRFNSDRYLPITEDEMERNLFEELADVTLMLYQVVYLLGCDEVVGEIANKKVKRTLERIQHGLIHKENNKMSKYGPGLSTNEVFTRYMSYMSKLDEEAKND